MKMATDAANKGNGGLTSGVVPVKAPGLVVPAHVAAQHAMQAPTDGTLNVERERVWHEDGLTDKDIPKPVGWRIMVEPIEVKKVTRGGLVLPDVTLEAQEYMRYVGQVVGMGALAYKHRKFEGGGPWCKIGDWILHGRYAGQEAIVRGKDGVHGFRFVNDDEILAVTESPEKLIIYAGIT